MPVDMILSQLYLFHIIPAFFLEMSFNTIIPFSSWSSKWLLCKRLANRYVFIAPPVWATHETYYNDLDL